MSTHKIDATQSGSHPTFGDYDIEYVITFNYTPGAAPIIHPVDNACPGWAAEIEFVSIEPDAGDHGAFTDLAQNDLIEWAKDWLEENYSECVEIGEAARHPDPDDARDQRIDDELTGRP